MKTTIGVYVGLMAVVLVFLGETQLALIETKQRLDETQQALDDARFEAAAAKYRAEAERNQTNFLVVRRLNGTYAIEQWNTSPSWVEVARLRTKASADLYRDQLAKEWPLKYFDFSDESDSYEAARKISRK